MPLDAGVLVPDTGFSRSAADPRAGRCRAAPPQVPALATARAAFDGPKR
jgi:hypothetical protein